MSGCRTCERNGCTRKIEVLLHLKENIFLCKECANEFSIKPLQKTKQGFYSLTEAQTKADKFIRG